MTSKQKLAIVAFAATLFGTSTAALAEDDSRSYTRGDSPMYDYARVLSSRPIVNYVTVTTPVRECWNETQSYSVDRHAGHKAGGTLLGAVIGGVIGHQVGSGRGKDAATIAGSLIGAAIGSDASRKNHRQYGTEQYSRPVERCRTSYRETREERIDGYRVTYRYNGQRYVTEMPYDPGNKIRVRVDVRPAG